MFKFRVPSQRKEESKFSLPSLFVLQIWVDWDPHIGNNILLIQVLCLWADVNSRLVLRCTRRSMEIRALVNSLWRISHGVFILIDENLSMKGKSNLTMCLFCTSPELLQAENLPWLEVWEEAQGEVISKQSVMDARQNAEPGKDQCESGRDRKRQWKKERRREGREKGGGGKKRKRIKMKSA